MPLKHSRKKMSSGHRHKRYIGINWHKFKGNIITTDWAPLVLEKEKRSKTDDKLGRHLEFIVTTWSISHGRISLSLLLKNSFTCQNCWKLSFLFRGWFNVTSNQILAIQLYIRFLLNSLQYFLPLSSDIRCKKWSYMQAPRSTTTRSLIWLAYLTHL